MDPSETVVVLTAADSEDDAVRIGKSLVKEKLAACVNIVPHVRSLYRWKDGICDEREWVLVIKSRRSLFPRLKDRILKLHTYEVPEVLCLNVADGDGRYLQWIADSTTADSPRGAA